MGATGSYCNCMERWWSLSEATLQEKINALERKYTTMETNTNTLHTKYSTLETKYEQLQKKMIGSSTDMESLASRITVVEMKSSNMLFKHNEMDSDMDCDIVIIE